MAQKEKGSPVSLEKALVLDTIPSGSGVGVIKGAVYIVGDDSPWLFELSEAYEPLNRYLLVEGFPLEGRIPKPVKPDLECMAEVGEGEDALLLIFGSGSKSPERDLLIKVEVQQPQNPEVLSLTSFYDHLLTFIGGTREEMNMEGAAVIENDLYLFNRGDNSIFVLDWKDLLDCLEQGRAVEELDIRQYKVELPEREGVKAGFSGACSLPGRKILFTATLEATENWIADGEILGSYLGILDVRNLGEGKPQRLKLIEDQDGVPILDKLESIAILRVENNGDMLTLAVADNDDGTTKLLEIRLAHSFTD